MTATNGLSQTAINKGAPEGQKVILFYKQGELPEGVFSNFAEYKIIIDDIFWGTSEIYFQAKKFVGTEHEIEVWKAENSSQAAAMGRDRSRPLRADWDSPIDISILPDATTFGADWEKYVGRPMLVKDYVMLIAVRAKFSQHKDLEGYILSTKGACLIEHTKNDSYWADGGDGSGQNILGKILMIVRDERARLLEEWVQSCVDSF
ncbi:MAG: NADAR family protein [Candidatus Obscuribacterales bacterium]|nr:NADAR family protein [Candidatus Obscuribacterales bacterium]